MESVKARVRREAEAIIHKANPNATIAWTRPLRLVTSPTGWRGFMGSARLTADGYRPATVHVDATPGGYEVSVR